MHSITCQHATTLMLCARALRCVPACSCPLHVCAHYTPLAKTDIPMEGLTKKIMGIKRAISALFTSIPCQLGGGSSPGLPIPSQLSCGGGGTHGSPLPLYISLSACSFSAGPPYTHQVDSCGGAPPRH